MPVRVIALAAKEGLLKSVFISLVLLYAALLLTEPALGSSDEKTTNFLVQDINRRYAGQRLNIFFDGVDRGAGRDVYFITGEYLKFKGASIKEFNFQSDLEARISAPPFERASPFDKPEDVSAVGPNRTYLYPHLPYSVFQLGPLPTVQRGDYLIVSPQSTKNYDRG